MKISLTYALVLAALLAANIAIAEEPEFQFSSGVDFTTGEYTDTEKTEILYIPASAKALFGNFQAKLTVPYIRITGPGTVVGGGEIGPITRDRIADVITTEDGIGDVSASLTYFTTSQDDTLFVDFTGKVKIPTASADKNLGTGETDVTIQADITKRIGKLNLLGTAGYRFMGDSDMLELNDGFIGSAGFSYELSKGTSAGLIYDYRKSASFRADSPSELTGFLSFKLSDHVRAQAYGLVGFSNGSPDTGVGFQLSYRP